MIHRTCFRLQPVIRFPAPCVASENWLRLQGLTAWFRAAIRRLNWGLSSPHPPKNHPFGLLAGDDRRKITLNASTRSSEVITARAE